jgi:lactoylglutathione lyase
MGTKLDMIGIFVNDLPTMVEFYRDVLGFEIDWDGNGPYAEFKHEGIRFSMFERAQLPDLLGQPPTFPSGLNGTFELAIDLPASADVDAEFERVVRQGRAPFTIPVTNRGGCAHRWLPIRRAISSRSAPGTEGSKARIERSIPACGTATAAQ